MGACLTKTELGFGIIVDSCGGLVFKTAGIPAFVDRADLGGHVYVQIRKAPKGAFEGDIPHVTTGVRVWSLGVGRESPGLGWPGMDTGGGARLRCI